MGRYVARRLLQMVPVFIGTTLLIFMVMYALPGDPVRALWGDKPPDPSQIAKIRHDLGLDQPLLKQYWDYLTGLFQGDFGTQIATGRPVAEILGDTFPVTLRLTVIAFTLTVLIGIPMGVLAGMRLGKLSDNIILIVTLLLISVPVFVMGFIAQAFLGFELGLTEPTVRDSMAFDQLLLPGIVLGALSLAYVTRLTRTSIAENRRADYVRTAIAKGMPRGRVVRRHLLRNSLIPVVTFLGYDLGSLMAGAVVTEGIFNVQGVGGAIYEALLRREGTTIVGLVTVMVLIYLVANLIVDLLYAVLDPRIRYA